MYQERMAHVQARGIEAQVKRTFCYHHHVAYPLLLHAAPLQREHTGAPLVAYSFGEESVPSVKALTSSSP